MNEYGIRVLGICDADLQKELNKNNKNKAVFLHCQCHCGKEFNTRQQNIKKIKSCGCSRSRLKQKGQQVIGEQYGRLTIVDIDESRTSQENKNGKHGGLFVVCKCDCGNIVDIFCKKNKVAITDPVYPVYLDTNVMSGRSGNYNKENGMYENIVYMPVTKENNFVPELPKEPVDMIYLCFPNNPTGTVLKKEELKKFVDYAKENKAIILFDAAYEVFITEENVPHSIYEIEGAKDVAIEFRSFSKTAGFTGVRCAYAVVPKTVFGYTKDGEKVSLNKLWNRRTTTKFNGVSYVVQRAAEATYSEEGRKQILENIEYYRENAKIIKNGLQEAGFEVFGGINSPYIWLKTPNNMKSWDFFDKLLEKANVVGTPGSGFGPSGEGYFRLTAFGTQENSIEAIKRIKEIEW